MYLKKVLSKKYRKKNYFLLRSWRSLTKIVGSGSDSRSKFQGSATLILTILLWCQAYLRENLLQQHMRSHQGLRPFVCNECGAQFTMKNNFKRHVEEHAGQRYATHWECGSGSGSPKSMRIRIRLAKVSADPDPAGQSQCGSGSGWPKSIQIRLAKIHADTDPVGQYQCGSGSTTLVLIFKLTFPLEFASFRIYYIPVDGSSILQFMSFSWINNLGKSIWAQPFFYKVGRHRLRFK